MKKHKKQGIKDIFFGFLTGLLSAAAGAGGGMITVPYLKSRGFSQKAAQQNAVAVILPLCAFSASLYILKGYVTLKQSLVFMPAGLAGAAAGVCLLNSISPVWLKIIFGGFMVWAGCRLCLA